MNGFCGHRWRAVQWSHLNLPRSHCGRWSAPKYLEWSPHCTLAPFSLSVFCTQYPPPAFPAFPLFWGREAVFVCMAVLRTFVSDLLLSFRHNFLFHANFSDDTNYNKMIFVEGINRNQWEQGAVKVGYFLAYGNQLLSVWILASQSFLWTFSSLSPTSYPLSHFTLYFFKISICPPSAWKAPRTLLYCSSKLLVQKPSLLKVGQVRLLVYLCYPHVLVALTISHVLEHRPFLEW